MVCLMKELWVGVLLLVGVAVVPSPSLSQQCAGDCDGNGQVTIGELVRGVNIALGRAAVDGCIAFDGNADGTVSVAELVRAVRAALGACAADTPTPTVTPLGPLCGDGSADYPEECDDGGTVAGDGCSATCALESSDGLCAGISSTGSDRYSAVVVAEGLQNPVHAAAPPLDPHRLYVVEQPGRIRVVATTASGRQLLPRPFLDIVDQVRYVASNFEERGLLSVAFHPDFESNGFFFVNYSCRATACPQGFGDGATVVSRFSASENPNRADPDSELVLLAIDQPFANHNGGQLAFGPDGYLYIGMGDGGAANDVVEAGQDDSTLLGKMLRMDVDVAEAPFWRVPPDNPNGRAGELGLIWSKGLRNPWRFSFDRLNGDLYIADVGQNTLEEVSVQPGDSRGGENYGWDIFEGTMCFEPDPAPDCPADRSPFVFPVYEYPRSDGISVTGGFVYRGCELRALRGRYLFSDYQQRWIRSFVFDGGAATDVLDLTDSIAFPAGVQLGRVSSYGEDARGELYLTDFNGRVFQIAPTM